MAKIGFIGMGNMGYAMLKGALAAFSPSDIIFSSPDREKCERISSETGVRFAESNAECGNNAKYIVLAVKPQMYPTVLKNIVNVVTEESIIISIAPGITIASIKNALGSNIRVVRAMPNTPALIGEGMTGVAYNASDYSFDERDVIDKFFTSFGKVVYVDEKLMDGVVCASGSSPAILNITPDHLNRHHTMECYAWTKERISENQTKADTCVLNLEDKYLTDFAPECKADVVWFSSERKPSVGAYVDGEMIKYTDGTNDYDMLNVHDMNLLGKHNYENVCAAIAMTKAAGIPDDIIIEQVKKFKAVEHRIEYVATKNGVDYYNDSKGTNPEAAVKAIEAMVKPTILIGGGYDKGSEFDLYVKAFKDKVKLLVLIGQTSAKIADTCKKYGFDSIEYADSMEQVVDICAKNAVSGDAVLLSPACASWGMFDNYEQRGRIFKDLVNNL